MDEGLTLKEQLALEEQKDAAIFSLKMQVQSMQQQLQAFRTNEDLSVEQNLRELLDQRNRDAQADGRQIKLQQERLESLAAELSIIQREKKEAVEATERRFRSHVRQLEEENSEQALRIEALQNQVAAMAVSNTTDLSSSPANLQLQVERSAVNGRLLSQFARKLQEEASDREGLATDLSTANERLAEYDERMREIGAIAEGQQKQMSSLADRAVSLEQQLVRSNAARDDAEKQAAASHETSVQVAALEADEIARLQSENKDLAAEAEALRDTLESVSRRNVATDLMETEIRELRARCECLMTQRAKLTQTIYAMADLKTRTLEKVVAVTETGLEKVAASEAAYPTSGQQEAQEGGEEEEEEEEEGAAAKEYTDHDDHDDDSAVAEETW
jgi:hypothetical protein